jgi:Ca-activated chloride channel family protein
MDMENRLDLVKRALLLLLNQLEPTDKVSLVTYGTTARTVLPPTWVRNSARMRAAIETLKSEGSTNVQAGILLGYEVAKSGFLPEGNNRIVLCSDGVANNGVVTADGIFATVGAQAARGITLSTVGFGMGNYNDVLMEQLAQKGQGNYAYVDRLDEARRIFLENLTGTLQLVARDVKVQVTFDPSSVLRYRLLGYENRRLRAEDFANDRVDAGEVGAGHAVTALYEVKLRPSTEALGTVRIRYKPAEGGPSQLLERPLSRSALTEGYAQASPSAQLAVVSAAFAEKLRGSYWVRNLSYARLFGLWEQLPTPLRHTADVRELGQLIQRARSLDSRPDPFERLSPVALMDFDRLPAVP